MKSINNQESTNRVAEAGGDLIGDLMQIFADPYVDKLTYRASAEIARLEVELDASQALLARRTEALEPFAKVGRALTGRAVSYSISARPGVSAPLVDANDFRRAFEVLSLVLVDEGDAGTSSFVADSGSTAAPKSESDEGLECSHCSGSGRVYGEPCALCQGRGWG